MQVILLIHNNPFFQNSAGANRLLGLMKGLQKLGADITLLITGGRSSLDERRIPDEGTLKGTRYIYARSHYTSNVWINRLNLYILDSLIALRTNLQIKNILKDEPASIIWIDDLNYHNMKLLVKNNCWLKRKHKYITEQSEFLDIHKFNKGNFVQRRKADKRKKFFENKFFPLLDGLAVMTRTLLSPYKKFPKPHPEYLHLPMTVDLQRFEDEYATLEGFKKPYIAFIGIMDDKKDGVSILINAFAKVIKKFPEHSLYLVGHWNYDTPKHQALIKKLSLESNVFWKKEFPRDQIPAILKNAELLVLPRPDSHQARGGFPTKLGEYLATGNPVCATSVGEIPDYLKDGESIYFAEPGSVDSFA
ncbi:MAG: glycosyltransferase family 4 protein, partial [Bacteroidetes bacterium]|nr:glycosyltransferase family 4 protein [Bacteroidota bacterium]